MKCSDCLMCRYNNCKSCELGHIFERFETNCPDFKPIDIRANIPEEDQVQKKPDFLAKCMNIPMVSFAKSEVEGVAELICDHYCKFPELIKKEDILHRICEGCPLNALMTYIQGGSNYVK